LAGGEIVGLFSEIGSSAFGFGSRLGVVNHLVIASAYSSTAVLLKSHRPQTIRPSKLGAIRCTCRRDRPIIAAACAAVISSSCSNSADSVSDWRPTWDMYASMRSWCLRSHGGIGWPLSRRRETVSTAQ
jgi:hypothetical protein